MRRLAGFGEAERAARFWSQDHYKWVYRTFLADREAIGALLLRHGVRLRVSRGVAGYTRVACPRADSR